MEYTLENEYLKLTVASLGAEVVSLVRKSLGQALLFTSMTMLAFLPFLRHRQLMPTAAPRESRSAFL